MEIDQEIEKIENKLVRIEENLKKHLFNYKKTDGDEKAKWKKESAASLKKKKFYEEYLNNLRKTQYEKEMQSIQEGIDQSKKEFEQISKEFYAKLSNFFLSNQGQEENIDGYEVNVDDEILLKEYLAVLPELDKYNEKLDLAQYINVDNR